MALVGHCEQLITISDYYATRFFEKLKFEWDIQKQATHGSKSFPSIDTLMCHCEQLIIVKNYNATTL
jgi:hypothetical protein